MDLRRILVGALRQPDEINREVSNARKMAHEQRERLINAAHRSNREFCRIIEDSLEDIRKQARISDQVLADLGLLPSSQASVPQPSAGQKMELMRQLKSLQRKIRENVQKIKQTSDEL